LFGLLALVVQLQIVFHLSRDATGGGFAILPAAGFQPLLRLLNFIAV